MELQSYSLINQKNKKIFNKTMFLAIVISLLFFAYFTSKNNVFMITGVVLLFAPLLFIKVENNLYLLFFFLSNERMLRLDGSSQTFLSLFIMLLALKVFYKNRFKLTKNELFTTLAIIITMLVKNLFISNSIIELSLIRMVLNLILVYGVIRMYNKNLIEIAQKSIKFYVIGCLVTSVLSFVFYWSRFGSLNLMMFNRFRGIGNDSNYYAVSLALGISLLLILFYVSKKKNYSHLVLSAVLFLFGALTLSRGFILANIPNILLGTIIFFKTKNYKRKKVLAFGIVILVLVSFGGVSSQVFQGFSDRMNLTDISSGRLDLWRLYFDSIFNNPISFLFGLGSFNLDTYQFLYNIDAEAHNIVLGALADNGIILTFVIIISLYLLFKFYKRKNGISKWKTYYSLPLLTLLFGYMFLTALTTNVFFWGVILSFFGGHVLYHYEAEKNGG